MFLQLWQPNGEWPGLQMSEQEPKDASDLIPKEEEQKPIDPLQASTERQKRTALDTSNFINLVASFAAVISAAYAYFAWDEASRSNEAELISGLERILIDLESANIISDDMLERQALSNRRLVLLASAEYIKERLNSNLHPAHIGVLANGYLKAGDIKNAVNYFNQAAESEDSSEILASAAHRSVAQIYAVVPGWVDKEKAEFHFTEALQKFAARNDPYALQQKCIILFQWASSLDSFQEDADNAPAIKQLKDLGCDNVEWLEEIPT